MTRIDFYVLGERAGGDRFVLACRLTEKAWNRGHRVYLHTGSDEEARRLDKLLWTFRQGSFLPHGLAGESDPGLNPILIGGGDDPEEEHGVLINLCSEVPPFFSRFERLVEPIDRDEQVRRTGRERFRFYRDRGYPLNSHEIER